ncbi:MAG: hypothetical protein ACQEQR_01650 [Pseudomonadota bacterium]
MSDLNTQKDDLATREMLEMMGELTEEQAELPADLSDIDMDDLLNSLDESQGDTDEPKKSDTTAKPSPADDADNDSNALDLEDIDTLMAQAESDSETEIEVAETTHEAISENQNDIQNELLGDAVADEDDIEKMKSGDHEADPSSTQASKEIALDDIEDTTDIDTLMAQMESTQSSEPADTSNNVMDNEVTEPENADSADNIDEIMAKFDQPADAEPTDSHEIDEDTDTGDKTSIEPTKEEMADLTEDVSPESSAIDDLIAQADKVKEMDTGSDTPAQEVTDETPIPEPSIESDANQSVDETIEINTEMDSGENESISDKTADIEMNNDNQMSEQASQSVVSMEEAIEIDQEIQEIASQVQNTAQEATLLALATSQKAHESAEKIQQAIEATFIAAERAFEAAKNAGYSIDLSELETQLSSPEISERLLDIQAKNKSLKATNKTLKARILDLND